MKLTFLGGAQTVTGSKHLLTVDHKNILIDCGLFQGLKNLRLKNWDPIVDLKNLDAILLTHAHIDHSGYIPKLSQQGYSQPIYSTPGTLELCKILLPDSGYLQEEDAARANRYGYSKHHPALPLYTKADAVQALSLFKSVPYGFQKQLFKSLDITATWYHAGHIIGASLVQVEANDTKILFTGDLGRLHDHVMTPPATIQETDYLVLESTYGNRLHIQDDPTQDLATIIDKTVKQGGTILIPAFAVGRTQLILYYLYQLKINQQLPAGIPIYLDSPMAENATDLMKRFHGDHKLSNFLCEAICNLAEYVLTPEQSKQITASPVPKIIISASGMATGGRILHHLKHYLPDSKNTVLLTGYQAEGTRGDRLLKGEPSLKIHGQMFRVKAKIEKIDGLSAHADQSEILTWLSGFRKPPKHVFIVHGDLESSEALKSRITADLGWNCHIPAFEEEVVL